MVRAIISTIVLVAFFGLFVHAAAEEMKCEGAIVKIEGDNVTVKNSTAKNEPVEQMLKMEPGTQITSGGKPVSVMDLKVGQKVKCVGDQRGGQMICTAMEIMRDTP
jgi:hypothetical protein